MVMQFTTIRLRLLVLALGILLALAFFAWHTLESEEVTSDNQVAEPTASNTLTTPATTTSTTSEEPAEVTLEPHTVTFSDGTTASYALAAPFELAIAAENLGQPRFLTLSPDGRLFVPNMVNFRDNIEGEIYILEDFNTETMTFETRSTYLTGLRNPHSLAFYTDEDERTWLYVAQTNALVRYPYEPGDISPSGEAEVIATFPGRISPNADNGVWHITRTILFQNDTLYVSVGSGCNLCEQPEEEVRALILAMDPDGSNERVYADGIKNAVGLAWVDDSLYATDNGVDHLGPDQPDDRLYRIEEGAHYGWPYCYEVDGAVYPDTTIAWAESFDCDTVPLSHTAFEPHSAPLGVTYLDTAAHPLLRDSFLVALHGSFDTSLRTGYSLTRVTRDGEAAVFMDGFQLPNNERVARPVHVMQWDQNSFFFTDDYNGRLYYVYAPTELASD